MKEIEFYKSKLKAIKLILLSLPFVAFSVWDLNNSNHIDSTWFNWLGISFFGLGILLGLFNLFDKRPEIIIQMDGIFSRSSYSVFDRSPQRGFIEWSDIADAYLYVQQLNYKGLPTRKHKYVCLVLKKNAKEKLNISKSSRRLSRALGLTDFIIPLIHLKNFDEEKFIELIKSVTKLDPVNRGKLLESINHELS